ncbi:MAG: hypothetical protein CMJ17_08350 [Phenylobacterium sp.]|nr:hypothetical protein [Phenylobacterium sp.]
MAQMWPLRGGDARPLAQLRYGGRATPVSMSVTLGLDPRVHARRPAEVFMDGRIKSDHDGKE